MLKRIFHSSDNDSENGRRFFQRDLQQRRRQNSITSEDEALAEYVDTKIIFQAGVDFESKPLVVVCACNLPDPNEVDYDKILSRILRKLDLFVESDYTVVLFAGGAQHRPGWHWMFRAYKNLSRKYKKNLKNLYIVHSTTWARVILDVMNVVISPKFGRKVKYIPTLSKLALYVPLTQIEIPPLVYTYNLKFEEKITLQPTAYDENGSLMFGVPIEVLMGSEGEKGLPRVVKDCVTYLRAEGLETEGIFRRSPSSVLLRQAREAYDRGNPINLADYGVHVAAVLLKMFFAQLPVSVFPAEIYETLRQIRMKNGHLERIEFIRETVFPLLLPPVVILLHYVCSLLYEISKHEKVNRMTPYNLAVMMAPNLVHSGNPLLDVSMCVLSTDSDSGGGVGIFMKLAIEHFELMFEGFEEPRERIRDAAVVENGNSLSSHQFHHNNYGVGTAASSSRTSSVTSESTEVSSNNTSINSPSASLINSTSPPKYPSIRRMRNLASASSPPNGSIRGVGAGVEISGIMVSGLVTSSPPGTPYGEEPGSPRSIDELRKAIPWN
ncbi:8016_t:CDS:2 [Ambispora leptoticha]|uniref:8016_t:CDS:1 n=1 Tax=Ambispora leptoticha TaxID=144679 RepID=A0A9N8VD84_9GLOM|nr:8016_t:CDS:2 [Ambispora leptoticha]